VGIFLFKTVSLKYFQKIFIADLTLDFYLIILSHNKLVILKTEKMTTVKNENHTIFNEVNNNDGVLHNYPSFYEVLTNENYKFHMLFSAPQYEKLKEETNKWELVANTVNYMCEELYDMPFFKSYIFKSEGDYFDYDKCINIVGVGLMYDSQGIIHPVDYETFLKLILVMYLSLMRIKLTDEQNKSYIEFKNSNYIARKVLD
jgi:hypothetical protein